MAQRIGTRQLQLRIRNDLWAQLKLVADATRSWTLRNVIEHCLQLRLDELNSQDVVLAPTHPGAEPEIKPAGSTFPGRDGVLKRGAPSGDRDGHERDSHSVYLARGLYEQWMDALFAMGERKSPYTEAAFIDYVERFGVGDDDHGDS